MKLKSLLIGSAAALVAVSGARAADVMAEPENVEYVRVCDTYGNGYFYIPGTETCLKFDGFVRSDMRYNFNDSPREDTSSWGYRVRLNVTAKNETDWGTLTSTARFQGDGNGGGDADVGIDRALIELAGFRLGYSDSFQTTWHGYGNRGAIDDGPYLYDQAIFLDYTYSANGFSAGVGIQDSNGDTTFDGGAGGIDPYIGLKYSQAGITVAASALYDSAGSATQWKASVEYVNDTFGVKAWYRDTTDPLFWVRTGFGTARGVNPNTYGGNRASWGVSASYEASDNLSLYVAYYDQEDITATFDGVRFNSEGDDAITFGASWKPVSGLRIQPEVNLYDDQTAFRLRVVRSF